MNKYGKLPGTPHDCLRELGFQTDPKDAHIIKRKWRLLSMQHHPDKGGDPELFHRVTHAYRFLTNPDYQQSWERGETGRGSADHSQNLDMILTMPISFSDGFFGKSFVCSFNTHDFDENFTVHPAASGELRVQVVTVTVPPGLFKEERIIFEGVGHRRGDIVGQMIAVIKPLPHPKFTMENIVISSHESVPIDTMIRGGTIEVETMRGIKRLKIPPGSMPGDAVMLEGVGIDLGNGKRLPQRVYIDPRYPTKEELKTKKSWKRFKIRWEKDKEEVKPGHAVFTNLLRLGAGI